MYSLTLTCPPEQAPYVSAELWDWSALAISESDGSVAVCLIAGFESNEEEAELLARFSAYHPIWAKDDTDYVAETKEAWPARAIGDRLFLSPVWNEDPTPEGRVRVAHNPGLASGTGEHPCTRLALEALERSVPAQGRVLDVGTGSGILAIAAILLGAGEAIAIDTDFASLATACENYSLNRLTPNFIAGSAEALADSVASLTVANISGSVLLAILDDLIRLTRSDGTLILTGFTESEVATFLHLFPSAEMTECNEWRCLTIPLFAYEP